MAEYHIKLFICSEHLGKPRKINQETSVFDNMVKFFLLSKIHDDSVRIFFKVMLSSMRSYLTCKKQKQTRKKDEASTNSIHCKHFQKNKSNFKGNTVIRIRISNSASFQDFLLFLGDATVRLASFRKNNATVC